jgi:hypothetical protein
MKQALTDIGGVLLLVLFFAGVFGLLVGYQASLFGIASLSDFKKAALRSAFVKVCVVGFILIVWQPPSIANVPLASLTLSGLLQNAVWFLGLIWVGFVILVTLRVLLFREH